MAAHVEVETGAPAERNTTTHGFSSNSAMSAAENGGEFERVFRHFDEDGDGKLSPAELCMCLRVIGEELSLEDATAVVMSIDSDGDGLLGLDDFIKLVEVEEEDGEEVKSRDLKAAFAMFEEDDFITSRSLKRMLSRLGNSMDIEQCKAVICRFDLNGDGVLSFEEFKFMMV